MLQYTDVRSLIRHVRTETERRRDLAQIQHAVVHYEAGPVVGVINADQEVAHILGVARFHQTERDFGGGALGRTIEYTYGIFQSGAAYYLNDESLVTWSHRNGNYVGLATVLFLGVGEFPSPQMVGSLRAHLDRLVGRPDMDVDRRRVWGHGETNLIYGHGPVWGNDTDCPGAALPVVVEYRTRGVPVMEPQNPDKGGFFIATGHSVGGGIGEYWAAHGGAQEFGYPLEQERAGISYPYYLLPELAAFTVQRFERQALAWSPATGTVVVRLGALVDALLGGLHTAV